ncbi:MAG: hypothetical protein HY559_06475 [Gammaproteobacteria bacterium]|nr:hypothetical protein [Gammaproteobacteria bacterium]
MVFPALAAAPIVDPLDLQDRMLRLERSLSGRKELDLLAKITQLESRERELLGQLEQRTHDIEQLKKSQREITVDLDKRIQALEQKMSPG